MTDQNATIPVEAIVLRAFVRPNIVSLLEFKSADFFAEEDTEQILHTDPEAALADMLSRWEYLVDSPEKLLQVTLTMSVSAYRRMPIEDFYRKAWPESLVEKLREDFGEEHGDEDGDDRLSDTDINELHVRMKDTVEWYLTRVRSHPCEIIRTWRFDKGDMLELIQQFHPEWLEKKP